MRRFLSIAVLFLSGLASIPAQAAIMVSVQNGNIVQGGGPQSLNVFARSTASDTLISIVVDFSLPDGGFFARNSDRPSYAGTRGNDVGLILEPGMLGNGSTGTSSFERGGSPFTTSSLSLDFAPAVLVPGTDQLIATVFIDPAGLALGSYRLAVDAVDPQGTAASIPGTGTGGLFTVVPIPEPTSVVLLGVGAAVAVLRRRRVL